MSDEIKRDILNLDSKYHDLFEIVAKMAYKEGRQHQFDDDFPEVGMHFPKSFKDTRICKLLEKNKPK